MNAANKKRVRSEAPRLSRDDWMDAAFVAVVEGGFDNVRVLVIAETLGVTRGSFYWHFTDHADLVAALIARWREREIEMDNRLKGESTADPAADLEQVLEVALERGGGNLENVRFELALRGLGRRDAAVAAMLVEVDAARMDLFESKFRRITSDTQVATDLAALFYLAITGSYQALSRPINPPHLKDYLGSIIAKYLIHRDLPTTPASARPARDKRAR